MYLYVYTWVNVWYFEIQMYIYVLYIIIMQMKDIETTLHAQQLALEIIANFLVYSDCEL